MTLPWFLLGGVCHQLPDHSFTLQGLQLPLCARCLGMYLGAAVTLATLRATDRASQTELPSRQTLCCLGLLLTIWAADGVNSLVTTLGGAPFLYPPVNWLRYATGLGAGYALGVVVYPIHNALLKPIAGGQQVLGTGRQSVISVAALLVVGIGATTWRSAPYAAGAWLCYLAVAVVLGLINSLLFVALCPRARAARTPGLILVLYAAGLSAALVETSTIASLRLLLLR